MNSGKKKLLPEITINAKQDEIDIGEENKKIAYELVLKDDSGNKIANYSAVDKDSARVELFVEVTRTDDENFPDPDNWITYRFAHFEGLKKAADGSLEIPTDKEKEFLNRLNKMSGKFIKLHSASDFGTDKGGKDKPHEGLKGTDMKYRIEVDEHPEGPGIRIDIYHSSEKLGNKRIAGERVKIKFLWNKRNQVNLETDGLSVIPAPSQERKWKGWQIALLAGASVLALLGIIFLIFHRQIKDWWRKRKNKKESQLEVF